MFKIQHICAQSETEFTLTMLYLTDSLRHYSKMLRFKRQ